MLDMNMKSDISARLTPQIPSIICHHMRRNLLKKEYKKVWRDQTRIHTKK